MLKHRKYRSGTKWCVWRWTDVDSEYIRRLHVIKTPWFAICLHWILKPDPEPHLHDHPVTFLSLILRGGYTETRAESCCLLEHCTICECEITHCWFNFIRAEPRDRHTIVAVKPGTLTLCFMGPKRREWGFHTSEGWVYWKDYYAKQRAEKNRGAAPEGTCNSAQS